jgi:IstB-like ATP binding protein
VSARYVRGSVIITSNKSYGDWGSIFGDGIVATAILDRLLYHSTSVNIRGESYRLKERRALIAGREPQAPPLSLAMISAQDAPQSGVALRSDLSCEDLR